METDDPAPAPAAAAPGHEHDRAPDHDHDRAPAPDLTSTPDLADLADLARDAWRLTADRPRTLLGIAGPPGAGKSTFARALVERIGEGAAYLPLDGFHLSNDQLERLSLTSRKGSEPSFDVRGYVALLTRVLDDTGHDIYVPDYDRTLHEPVAARHRVPPAARLVVTEGNYLACDLPGWREARELMGECWYVLAPAEVRQHRLIERQLAGGRTAEGAAAWVATNDGPNGDLVEKSRRRCDRIVSTIGMDMFNYRP